MTDEQFAAAIGLNLAEPGAFSLLQTLKNAYLNGGQSLDTIRSSLQAYYTPSLATEPQGSMDDIRSYSLGGQSIGDMLDSGQAFITPEGAERSFFYLGGLGDPAQAWTNEQVESLRDDQQTRRLQGSAQVSALVGGAAALGATPWGAGGAAAADGLTPITVGAQSLPGGNAAVQAAIANSWGGAIPAMASLPSLNGINAAGAGAGILDSSGSVIPGTESAGGGGMFENLFSGGFLQNWGPLLGGLLGAIDANNQPDSLTMNQGGTSTSTYSSALPEEFDGRARSALNDLMGLYGAVGAPVAGVNATTQGAINRLGNLGSNPFATGANQNTAPTTSMFAGGQTINPYLDQVFNTAADSTQNRLATEFAHAGLLNTGSHQQSRSQELQNLAAGIYAPGFEAERSRQYGAAESGVDRLLAQMEANLGRQYGATEGNLGRELSSILPMLSAGEYMRGIEQQQLDAPWELYSRFLGGLQGLAPFFPASQTQNTTQTGSVTQPLFSNPLAGFLGGSQLGSLLTRA